MHLDEAIILLLRKNRGRATKGRVREHFNNYSRGYVYDRLQALKNSNLIEETGEWYILTNEGWGWRIDTTT